MGSVDDALPGHVLVRVRCAVCGAVAARVELVPPGGVPSSWDFWSQPDREFFARHHDPSTWRFYFEGIEAGNASGDDITAEAAAVYLMAFSDPLEYEKVQRAGLYDDAGFCAECRLPYCYEHWNVSRGGYGRCPQGHGRSLDPHWSPSDYD